MWEFTPYIIPLIFSGTITLLLAISLWRSRATPAVIPVIVYLVGSSVFSGAYALELAGTDFATKLFAFNLRHVGIASIPVSWFIFAAIYTGNSKWINTYTLPLLAAHPLFFIASFLTNPLHELTFRSAQVATDGVVSVIQFVPAPLFYINVLTSYVLIIAGIYLVLTALMRTPRGYRGQGVLIVVGVLFPFIGSMVYVFRPQPLLLDLTPYTLTVSGVTLVVAILGYRLFDSKPIARDKLIEMIADMVIVIDLHGRIVDLNQSAQVFFGILPGATLLESVEAVFADYPALVRCIQPQSEVTGVELELEKDGSTVYLDVRLSTIYVPSDGDSGSVVILRDITERKQTEEMNRQYAAQLEAQNAELDAYAHSVAHDLKSPLTVLIGYSDYLNSEEEFTQEDIRTIIKQIGAASYKQLNIVNELLLLSSVRTLDEVALDQLDMGRIVWEAEKRLAHLIERSGAVVTHPEKWPKAVGYGAWIEEVWANYMSNALKYGGVPPQVELGAEALPDGMVRFWVKDNGGGLSEEQQTALFKEFERLGQKRVDGHGLGLSVVKRIVEKLGGEVGVESKIGEGCKFYFTLPRVEASKKVA